MATAERVSTEVSDNFVMARSILAYQEAAKRVSGKLLEIGTGSGYGIKIVSPASTSFITVDKHNVPSHIVEGVDFRVCNVPPLPFCDGEFDSVISFQVIEHIKRDKEFINEVARVLRPNGLFIVTTPNAPASLTRNPWHIREYTAQQFEALISDKFDIVERCGVFGDSKVLEYYNKNRESVKRITKWDILNLQYLLPRWILQIPYDILNRINRRRLHKSNTALTEGIKPENYSLNEVDNSAFDLFYVLRVK